jgi:hypothetical protein
MFSYLINTHDFFQDLFSLEDEGSMFLPVTQHHTQENRILKT